MGASGSLTNRQKTRIAARAIERRLRAHPCGTCTVCCTVKQVAEIEKPEGVPCAHLCTGGFKTGCGVYPERPQACKDYFCGYRYGLVGDAEERRPDKLGLMFEVAEKPPPGIMMLAVREVVPGAFDTRVKELTEIAATGVVLYLMKGEKRYFMGPEERVKACQEWSRRHLPLVVP